MGKSRQIRNQHNEPTQEDSQLNTDIPRKYRQLVKWMNRPKVEKSNEITRTEDELRKLANKSARASTNTFLKRKAWLNSRKKEKVQSSVVERSDVVRFGEVAMEPPSISVKPKGVFDKSTRQIPLIENSDKIKRKRKLKDLPEAERAALLKVRQNMIDAYRTKKNALHKNI